MYGNEVSPTLICIVNEAVIEVGLKPGRARRWKSSIRLCTRVRLPVCV